MDGLSSKWKAGRQPPARLLSPRARFRRRTCQKWPAGSGRPSSRRTAPATASPATCRREERPWLWAGATLDSRSRRNCPLCTRFTSQRLAADAAAAAVPRPRPLLVADEVAPVQYDGRIPAGTAAKDPGDAHRLEPPRAQAALRSHAEAAGCGCERTHSSFRRRERARGRRGHLGDWVPPRLLLDRPPNIRSGRPSPPPARRDGRARPLLPRADVAAHTGSALIGWVRDDAEFIARQVEAFHEQRSTQAADRHQDQAERELAPVRSRRRV
jgi:hypothetical protein